jgi:hypothetical protein
MTSKSHDITYAKIGRTVFLPRYFKCLSSDFYKNKRGQIIFVHETMVKSKSKTVDLSKDEKKVDEFKHIQ